MVVLAIMFEWPWRTVQATVAPCSFMFALIYSCFDCYWYCDI